MSKQPTYSGSTPVHAAGGVILGVGDNVGKIAIVRRRRYGGEIALPKGKLRMGEDPAAAALREVAEETGYEVKIRERAGATHYLIGSVPKDVTYFLMEPVSGNGVPRDSEEIASVEWVTPQAALGLLTHRDDQELISQIFKLGQSPPS